MKENLKVLGNLELTRHEVSEAIIEYVARKKNYRAVRVVYESYSELKFSPVVDFRAIVEVSGTASDPAQIPQYKPKYVVKPRGKHRGFTKRNKGVFSFLRETLNSIYDEQAVDGTRVMIPYVDIHKKVMAEFPFMTRKKLRLYLCDRKQLDRNNFTWTATEGDGCVVMTAKFSR